MITWSRRKTEGNQRHCRKNSRSLIRTRVNVY